MKAKVDKLKIFNKELHSKFHYHNSHQVYIIRKYHSQSNEFQLVIHLNYENYIYCQRYGIHYHIGVFLSTFHI